MVASPQSSSGTVPQYRMVAAYCNFVNLCVCSPEGRWHHGLHQQRAGSGQEGIVPFSSAIVSEAPSGALHQGLGPQHRLMWSQRRVWGCSEGWSSSAMEIG